MIDQEQKAITVLGDICRTCPKQSGTGQQCVLCTKFWHGQGPVFDRSKFEGLPQKTIEALEKMEAYELPAGVLERLMQKPPYSKMDGKQIHERIGEFKKFMAILAINHTTNRRIEMISEEIDEIWHTFILSTKEYYDFSKMLVGEYIHHIPNISIDQSATRNYQQKLSINNFLEDYQNYFGQLATVWKIDAAAQRQEINRSIRKRIGIAATVAINVTIALLVFNFWNQSGGVVLWYIGATFLPVISGGIILNRLAKQAYSKRIIMIGTMITFSGLLALGVILALICSADLRPVIAAFSMIFIMSGIMFGYYREKRVKSHSKNGCGGGVIAGVGCSSSGGGGGCGGGCGGGGC